MFKFNMNLNMSSGNSLIMVIIQFNCFQSVIVKSIERNAPNMYMARQKLLGQECESCAANHHAGHHSGIGMNGTTLPLAGLNVGSLGKQKVVDFKV